MMPKGIISIYTHFSNSGGAQKIAVDLHQSFEYWGKNLIMSFDPINSITEYNIKPEEYLKFNLKNIFTHKSYIFISHHRKTTTLLELFNRTFFLNLKIIHVAHNEFYSLKKFTLFPKNIIAVSHKVKENHIDYFGLSSTNVQVIYNGIKNHRNRERVKVKESFISILYPARINSVKGQLELIKNLSGKMGSRVKIDFAGVGDESEDLKKLCQNNGMFNYLGFMNISEIIDHYDFVMLFSKNEGLPLSLIEAGMFSKPVITNKVGGNPEIIQDKKNGFLLENYEELAELLKYLPKQEEKEYRRMCKEARQNFENKFEFKEMVNNYKEYIFRNCNLNTKS